MLTHEINVDYYFMFCCKNCRNKYSFSSYFYHAAEWATPLFQKDSKWAYVFLMKDRSEIYKEAMCQCFQWQLIGNSDIGNYGKHKI